MGKRPKKAPRSSTPKKKLPPGIALLAKRAEAARAAADKLEKEYRISLQVSRCVEVGFPGSGALSKPSTRWPNNRGDWNTAADKIAKCLTKKYSAISDTEFVGFLVPAFYSKQRGEIERELVKKILPTQ